MTPITPPGNATASDGAATRPKKKAKTKAAKASAGEAGGADQKGASPFLSPLGYECVGKSEHLKNLCCGAGAEEPELKKRKEKKRKERIKAPVIAREEKRSTGNY
jgi:hypothetical protein